MQPPEILQELAEATGGKIENVTILPDGSGAATMSFPLPKDHWLLAPPEFNVPPMPFRMGTDSAERELFRQALHAAGRYAVRCATMNGTEIDFDPDALVQNLVVGMLGYHTPTGLSSDDWANPQERGSMTTAKKKAEGAAADNDQADRATENTTNDPRATDRAAAPAADRAGTAGLAIGRMVYFLDREELVSAVQEKRKVEYFPAFVTRVHRDPEGQKLPVVNLFVMHPELGVQLPKDIHFGGHDGAQLNAPRWFWPVREE